MCRKKIMFVNRIKKGFFDILGNNLVGIGFDVYCLKGKESL